MKLICQKGWHDFWVNGLYPQIPRFWCDKKHIRWKVVLDSRAVYQLPGEEWRDWNKGGGLTYNYLNHLVNTAMWSFRWNPTAEVFEYGAYCHVDGKKVLGKNTTKVPDREVMLAAKLGTEVIIDLYIDPVYKTYRFVFSSRNKTSTCIVEYTHQIKCSKEITANFGGNNKAPSKIIIDITNL